MCGFFKKNFSGAKNKNFLRGNENLLVEHENCLTGNENFTAENENSLTGNENF